MRWLLIIASMFFLGTYTQGQVLHSNSKKAIRHYERAVESFQGMDMEAAELALKESLEADSAFLEAHQLLAQIYYDQQRLDEAIASYEKSMVLAADPDPEGWRRLAGLLRQNCAYERALHTVEAYLALAPERTPGRSSGEALREQCLFALEAMADPVPFEPVNLGDSVNSELNEYWPALSVDEKRLMFTVLLPVRESGQQGAAQFQEDLYHANKSGEGWSRRQAAGAPLNSPDNEGAHSMTANGSVLFFTACNRRGGRGQCDLYLSMRQGDGWGSPFNLGGPINTRHSEKQPSISADGRTLVFSSNRPGGSGSYDLWVSHREGESWSEPVNLGESVNTPGMEQSPFLHPDGLSLYFSSTGWPGLGKGDLFVSRRQQDSTWSPPQNLGYPINSCDDDFGFFVNARGNTAYFASDRGEGEDTDIYHFELPEFLRPVPVSYLTGRVHDSEHMKGVEAVIQLIDLEDGAVIMEGLSEAGEGDYLLALPTDRDYALNVSAPDYLFYSAHFEFRGEHPRIRPFRRDIPLVRIEVGSRVVLKNIFFETDSHELKKASEVELERIRLFLEQNPDVSLEVGGHTDHRGSDEYNLGLSQRRALAVQDALLRMGVEPGRVSTRGYGDGQPLGDNESKEGMAMNRRTEIKITNIAE